MSEFDKLKDEAEKEMKEHPEQVKEGQQAVEKSSPGPPVRTDTTRAMRRKATRPASRRAGNAAAQGRRAPLSRLERSVLAALVAARACQRHAGG